MSFIHLHTHSHYSLLDGLPKIDELVNKAKEYGMEALALTDHGVMYGAIEFYQKCKQAGIKPIIGIEAYLAPRSRHDKQHRLDNKYYHLVLLARNFTGYQNLIKLTSKAHLEGFYYKPRIDWELLKQYSEGLIALSACLKGQIPQILLGSEPEKVYEAIKQYQAVFGKENFYLEVQHHPGIPEQQRVNQKIYALAEELKIKVVATNDVHYIEYEDREPHDILICLQTKSKKTDQNRMSYLNDDFSFRSPERMRRDFANHPEVIENTLEIARRCNLEIPLGKYLLPHYPIEDKKTPEEKLKELCLAGLKKRYPEKKDDPLLKKRLEYELSVINKTGFASYFLIVQDFVNWAKNNNIVVGPGRGSAAGSLVSYLLNITDIDPIKYELIFERFLNPNRISMPDIDLDFNDTRRDEVIHYVANKYGHDHVAQIITFGTMAARVVVRDVGRVLGIPYSYCDQLAKLIPMFTTLDEALKLVPELREKYENEPEAKAIIDNAKKLEGCVRHTSTHACGVVITPEPITNYVPLQYSATGDNDIVTQYSLGSIEALGLLKMDFLGLKNLTIIENTLEIIEKIHGQRFTIDSIPLNDKKTFALLQAGETTGVFQLESSGMKRYLKQLKPSRLEDIIAMVALYRPGPMEFIKDFIDGKHGRKKISYLHPKLKPILEKTYGIAVYQEQIMQIARDLAGFTYAEADVLRKAVGKKIKKLLDAQEEKMIAGMVKNGIDKKTAKKIWKFILPFARYGFNRAHATSYALIAYYTAYLKANYPAEFMAALLTSDLDNFDRVAIEIEECRRMGIEVLPPDINESFSTFTVIAESIKEGRPRIRFGLNAIKNVGANVVKAIVRERKQNGPYKSLADFLYRIHDKDLNKKSLEALIKSGSLDKLGERGQMIANLDQLLKYNKTAKQLSSSKQTTLFGFTNDGPPPLTMKSSETISQLTRLNWEKEMLGLYITSHPLQGISAKLKNYHIISCHDSKNFINKNIKILGIVTGVQRIITRSAESMLFVTIEDETGSVEALIFPKLLKQTRSLWQEGKIIIIKGKISDKDGETKILAEEAREVNLNDIKKIITPSSSTKQTQTAFLIKYEKNRVCLEIPGRAEPKFIDNLKQLFASHPGPHKVFIIIKQQNIIKKIATNFSISYNEYVHRQIELTLKQFYG